MTMCSPITLKSGRGIWKVVRAHKQSVLRFMKIVISAVLIIVLLQKVGFLNLRHTISSANIGYLTIALAFFLTGVFISSYKWQILLSVHRINIRLLTLVSFYFISMFLRNFLSTIGGEAYKIYSVSKLSKDTPASIASVFLERGSGLLALLTISILTLLLGYERIGDRSVIMLIVVLFVGYLCVLAIIFNRTLFNSISRLLTFFGFMTLQRKLAEMHNAIYRYIEHRKSLLKVMVLSFCYQVVSVVFVVYIISQSLQLEIPVFYFFLFCPLIGIFEMLPISLNGIGVREGAFLFFFTKAGVSGVEAISMSLLVYAIAIVAGLIGGLIYASRK